MGSTAIGALTRVLAWRRVTARPLRSCVTAAGIAASVAFLFSILSLNAQLASTARDTAALLKGPRLLQVVPASSGGLPEDLADRLGADPRVAAATPFLVRRATMANGPFETGMFVIGGNFGTLLPGLSMPATEQRSLGQYGGDVVLSRKLADRLHVRTGGVVTVGGMTDRRGLRVRAVVASSDLDRIDGGMVATIPLDLAQSIFGRNDRVDQIMVLAAPHTDLKALQHDVATSIEGTGLVGPPGTAVGENANFALLRSFTNFVGVFVVLAALMLVFHTMATATAERRTEIALARALGSSRRQLMFATLFEAGLLGVVGTAIGLLLGAALARLVVPLTRYMYANGSPVDLPTNVTLQTGPAVLAAVAGIAGATIGALLPARSAARAAPVDAFRPTATYEWREPAQPKRERTRVALGGVVSIVGLAFALFGGTRNPNNATRAMVPLLAVYVGVLILVPSVIPIAARAAAAVLNRLSSTTGRLAADSLRANPRRTTINVIALLIPVAAVAMTAVAFGSGLTGINRLARAAVGAPLNVDADSYVNVLGGSVASQPLTPFHQGALEAIPGVRAVLPYQNANIRLPDASPGILYAIPFAAAARAETTEMVTFARLADNPADLTRRLLAGEIGASRVSARLLGLKPGSNVILPTPSGPRTFTVGALFDDWAFQGTFAMDLDLYRSVWGDERAYRYAIVPSPGASPRELAARINIMTKGFAIPAQAHTRDRTVNELKANTTIFLPLTRAMTLVSLLFAALALANAAFADVTERRRLLALQRTLGMTNRQIGRSLALESATVGVIGAVGGGIVGVGLGVVSARILAYQVALTIDYAVPWTLIIISIILGVMVAVGATHYARRMAKRIPIIEALRFE